MRKDGIIYLDTKSRKMLVSAETIGEFEILGNRRDLRKPLINKLFRLLESGENFDTPLMANLKSRKLRLLDGNHRYEAMKLLLEKYPERKIEIDLAYYEGLDEEQEREKYTKWNMGTKQTTNDFVKQYWDTFPIVKQMERDFPCKISHIWAKASIELKQLLMPYVTKTSSDLQVLNASKFIDAVQELDRDDYNSIKQFMKEYISVFGSPDRKNMHYGRIFFSAMFRIWIENRLVVPIPKMQKAFSRFMGHERTVYYYSQPANRDTLNQCRLDLVRILNGSSSNKVFT